MVTPNQNIAKVGYISRAKGIYICFFIYFLFFFSSFLISCFKLLSLLTLLTSLTLFPQFFLSFSTSLTHLTCPVAERSISPAQFRPTSSSTCLRPKPPGTLLRFIFFSCLPPLLVGPTPLPKC